MDSENAITVTYKGEGDFEILVKPDEAFEYRRGNRDNFESILFVREVFKDAQAAERASAAEIEEAFGTRNIEAAARKVFENGSMELTTEQKNQLREEKWNKVATRITTRAMNPQTNSPHPRQRIENAMEEAGIDIDPMEDPESQFKEAIEAIRPILPISLEEKEVGVKIPNNYAGKCYGKLKSNAQVLDEEWGDEAFMAKLKMPAGAAAQLESELNEICHGDVEFRDL